LFFINASQGHFVTSLLFMSNSISRQNCNKVNKLGSVIIAQNFNKLLSRSTRCIIIDSPLGIEYNMLLAPLHEVNQNIEEYTILEKFIPFGQINSLNHTPQLIEKNT